MQQSAKTTGVLVCSIASNSTAASITTSAGALVRVSAGNITTDNIKARLCAVACMCARMIVAAAAGVAARGQG